MTVTHHRFWTFAVFALSCWLWSYRALAQTPSEIALAREQFTVGVEAARAADWPRALSAFERSYALYVHPETLFNIAGARQKLGKLVAASEAYRTYLRSPAAASDLTRRTQAEARLAELSTEIARVGIRVQGIADGDVLMLDGQALSRGTLDSDLPVDPGEHTLRLMAGAEVVGETQFAVHARERIEVLLRRTPEARAAAVASVATPRQAANASLPQEAKMPSDTKPDREPGGRPLVRQWWLWTSVGAVVVAGVVAAVLITHDDDAPREVQGNVGTRVVEIP